MKKLYYKIKCFFGYHSYVYLSDLSDQASLLKCEHCGEKFALHVNLGTIIPFTQEVADFYELGIMKYLKKYNNKKGNSDVIQN